jgi:hypothetical protein
MVRPPLVVTGTAVEEAIITGTAAKEADGARAKGGNKLLGYPFETGEPEARPKEVPDS